MVYLEKHSRQRSQIQFQSKYLFQQGKVHYEEGVQNNQFAAKWLSGLLRKWEFIRGSGRAAALLENEALSSDDGQVSMGKEIHMLSFFKIFFMPHAHK